MKPTDMQIPWVESPFFEEELEKSNLDPKTKELIRNYSEQGFVIIDPEISEDVIDEAVAALKPEFAKQNYWCPGKNGGTI